MAAQMPSRKLKCTAAEVADDAIAVVNHLKPAERREEGSAVVEFAHRVNTERLGRLGGHGQIIRTANRLDNGGRSRR